MKKLGHFENQKRYFNKEYSRSTGYKLLSWQKQYLSRINKYLLKNDYKNKTLLDIAAGSGYISIEMAKRGLKVIALEISEQAIKNLHSYKKTFSLKNFKILSSRAEKLHLPDRSVDYVVANAILEHIPQEKVAIKEWLRVLKKGGRLYITVPLKYKYIWPFFWPINYIHDKLIGHLRRYDLEDLERKFKLKTMKVFYTGHFLKMIGFFMFTFFNFERFDNAIEEHDSKLVNRRYGASNISVVFEKPKL